MMYKANSIEPSSMSKKKKAFSKLESLRKKASYNLDYDEELASYREKKYGNENGDRGDYTAEKYKEAEDEVIEKLAIGRAQNENGEGIPFDEAMRRIAIENGFDKKSSEGTQVWNDAFMEELQGVFKKMIPGFRKIFGEALKSIVLFGSVARGTQTEESDVDIAVIAQGYTEDMHGQMIDLAVDLELEYDEVLSVIMIDYENFMEWEDVLPFYKNIKKDGIVLWKAEI